MPEIPPPPPHHTPKTSQPRIVNWYVRPTTAGAYEWRGTYGCSDEWLAGDPGWARDPDGPDVMGRLAVPLSRCLYVEGEHASVHVTVDDLREGRIAERTWTLIGAGEPVSALEAAKIAGVKEPTWRGYVSRGQAPSADYPTDAHGAVSARFGGPWWKGSTVKGWADSRVGQGARTDLRQEDREEG